MLERFGVARCCCVEKCWEFNDGFDRTASTIVGEWHEEHGDWETIGDPILGGWLHELAATEPGTAGTANAKIYGTQPVPDDGEMMINVSIVDPQVGDVFFIYLGCNDIHGAGGRWVSFTYTGIDTWLVTLSTGEYKTQTFTPIWPLDTTTPVYACLDSDGFFYAATASAGEEFPWNDGDAVSSGRYYGLGHNNPSTGAKFDSFRARRLRTDAIDCVSCFCHCGSFRDRNNLKKTLALTVFDAVDRALCMDGASVGATWEWNGGMQRWVSDVLTVSGGSVFKWVIRCGTHDPAHPFAHLTLNWFDDALYKKCCAANSAGCDGVYYPDPLLSTCVPLNLVYGPFKLSVGELTCNACYAAGSPMPPAYPMLGTYYIAVTEAV